MKNYTVNNTLTIQSSSADEADAIRSSLLGTYPDLVTTEAGSFQFSTEWEPPLKEFSDLAKRFAGAKMELVGEAFDSQHWICIATAEQGKTTSDTLTRIDGEQFERVFEKVFNRPFSETE